MDPAQIYAERIRYLCKQNGLTIYQLSKKSELALTTLTALNAGKTKDTRVQTLIKIARVFGMTLGEFLAFEVPDSGR